MERKIVYVDNAATTPVTEKCLNAMLPFFKQNFANPSSTYSIAHTAKNALEKARTKIANCLNALPEEIYFTSCGSESNNWAIRGSAQIQKKQLNKNKIITTNFEHHSVLNCCKALESEGFEVVYLPVDQNGLIFPEQLEKAIDEQTALVSIMTANNEIGTILPIAEIGKICRKKKVLFHTDAVQAMGHMQIDVQNQNIDFLSFSGHKIGAPKGIGVLWAKKGVPVQNLIFGGAQERGKRAGTENVAFAVGLATCLEHITSNIEERESKIKKMQTMLLDGILKTIPKVRLNGSLEHRLNSNLNFSFEGIEGESILLMLDSFGICASSGSACTSNSLDPSHVLLAIGLKHETAHGSLRISLSENNTIAEMEYILKHLPEAIKKLRLMSPLWNQTEP